MLKPSGDSQCLDAYYWLNILPLLRYDSLVYNGQVRWQDRLNNHNLPFFLPSTGLFTNYTVSLAQRNKLVLNGLNIY